MFLDVSEGRDLKHSSLVWKFSYSAKWSTTLLVIGNVHRESRVAIEYKLRRNPLPMMRTVLCYHQDCSPKDGSLFRFSPRSCDRDKVYDWRVTFSAFDGWPTAQCCRSRRGTQARWYQRCERAICVPWWLFCMCSSDWVNISSQYTANNTQRILSYLTTKDRMVLIVALICSMASGVVSWLCFGTSIAKHQGKVTNRSPAIAYHEYRFWWAGR